MTSSKPSVISLIGFGPEYMMVALQDSGDLHYQTNARSLSSALCVISAIVGMFLGMGVGKLVDTKKVKLWQAILVNLSVSIAACVVMIW